MNFWDKYFWDKCEDIIRESETIQEAVDNCIKYANDNGINIHTEDEIHSAVDAMWGDYENDGQPDWQQEWEDFGECYE